MPADGSFDLAAKESQLESSWLTLAVAECWLASKELVSILSVKGAGLHANLKKFFLVLDRMEYSVFLVREIYPLYLMTLIPESNNKSQNLSCHQNRWQMCFSSV